MTEWLGASVFRREGVEKLTGLARYVDDLPHQGTWWGGTVRSTEPRARLEGLDRDPAFPWDRVVVVTAADCGTSMTQHCHALM